MTDQLTLALDVNPHDLNARQFEVYAALGKMIVAGDTAAIQRTIAEYIPTPRDRNCIAKRLCELEAMGLVERVGQNHPTVWRRK